MEEKQGKEEEEEKGERGGVEVKGECQRNCAVKSLMSG